ncbi:MAG: acetyl-CoA carboxylase biotin carboxylase subunit [Cytophagaceae bacterium]|nr:acetyl-CoA carboxylase biotin carboxylase subunit [Cytophagaceae bacterium]
MTKIQKLLIANRGEIALRVIRSAKEMGIKTVAIYSEADRNSLHVRNADEAYCIGPPPSAQSYLNIQQIIQVCKKAKVDAIHPGYGFLSENAEFAAEVKKNKIIFIGPSPQSIEIMGSKLAAKDAASKFKIPMVPGGDKAVKSVEEARNISQKIGYPVLIKASAGGGGKGMRIVEDDSQLEENMKRATSEALSAFGDGSVFIEKYISSPKHIEIQILGDQHGNIIYLFERECSIQRRYQKVVEEAPSSAITPQVREAMGKAAVDVARSCNYFSAGTVEFILDENLNYYFLEMNTRLQVEHPVTEMITGIDLVKEQIKIAQGEKLQYKQEDLSIRGHAIELRVYAEDPSNNFLPDIGKLKTYERPQGPGIRVDDGYEEGMDIPIYYDPMIAKLVVHASTRAEAIERMIRAVQEYKISGVANTLQFGEFVMKHPSFQNGKFDTHFVSKYFSPDLLKKTTGEFKILAAAFAGWYLENNHQKTEAIPTTAGKNSKWKNRLKD